MARKAQNKEDVVPREAEHKEEVSLILSAPGEPAENTAARAPHLTYVSPDGRVRRIDR